MKAGFIGAGKMAEAIITALIGSKVLDAHAVFACDISRARRDHIRRSCGVNVYSRSLSVVDACDVVFLAVKPQDLDAVLAGIAPRVNGGHLVVSIVAGKRVVAIESVLSQARVVRVMPNLASVVGEGMSAFCAGQRATPADRKTTARLLASFGRVVELPESRFDAVTALSGSGPAFFAYVLELLVRAAVEEGLAREDAVLLAEQTMLGTSRVLIEQGTDPHEFIKAVASPGGTTEAGLKVLDRSDIADTIRRTIAAAAARSRELSA